MLLYASREACSLPVVSNFPAETAGLLGIRLSQRRPARRRKRSCGKARRGQWQSWGEYSPLDGRPRLAQKNFDPEHPPRDEGPQGQKPCSLCICLIKYSLCCVAPRFRPMYLAPTCRSLCHHFCPHARRVMLYWLGGKRSKVSPRGALSLSAAR